MRCALFIAATTLASTPRHALSQTALAEGVETRIELAPNESRALQVMGTPHSLQVLKVNIEDGLLGVHSPEAARRLLDLGRGGSLLFSVEIPASGVALVDISSGEHLRNARATVKLATADISVEQATHLRTAGIAFGLADSTRRHQPHAPEPAAALALYDQAAAEATAADDPSLARWALTQKARFLLYQKSSFLETRQLLERAATLSARNDEATLALLYKTLSSCEYFLGDLAASVEHGERSLALYRVTGDKYWQGVVLGNLIAGYGELGRNGEAAASAREGLTDAEQTQDTAGVVFCLTELANLYRKAGSLQLAFQSFREAQNWAQDIRYAPLVQAEIEQALGQFYADLGLWSEAQDHLEECLRHASPNGVSALEARGLLARTAARSGDLQRALREYESALSSARTLKLVPEEAALLLARSSTLLQAHRAEPALADAHSAAQLAEGQNAQSLRVAAALAEGAACLQACSDKSQAQKMYQDALAWIEETGEREQQSAAYAGLAQTHAALGDNAAGLEDSERSLAALEHLRASFASHDLAASYFEEHRAWYALAIDLAVRLDRLHPGQGYGARAFQFSESARARAMLDSLGDVGLYADRSDTANTMPSRSGPVPLLRRISANQNQIETQKERLLSEADPRHAAAVLQKLYREQDALYAERKNQEGGTATEKLREVVSLHDVQVELLDKASALVAITFGQHATYRWFITSTSVHVDVLPSEAALRQQVEPLLRALQQRRPSVEAGENAVAYAVRVQEFDEQRSHELERAGSLLLPAVPRNIHHLYVVADGVLQTLPWGALRTTCDGRACYAVERFAVSMEPSASVAIALTRRSPAKDRGGTLVVSDTLPGNDSLVPRWRALPPLPGSQREADAIRLLSAERDFRDLRRGDATVANLTTAMKQEPRILHLAAHTLLVDGHPELSGIALSGGHATSSADGGILWLHDIPLLKAPPLVVLSGCRTQGANPSGEELNTLTQAFFYGGAQQVVASNWKVDDDATVEIMREFYRNMMLRRMPATDALRQAQLHMIGEGTDVADWAGFLIDGAPAHPGTGR